jgi:hypothetical protein
MIPGYLDPGAFTINGTGGTAGNFQAAINVPQPLNWTNQNAIATIQRSAGVEVTWTGGDPNGLVSIIGNSIDAGTKVMVGFVCTEQNAAGRFTVPPHVLLALPVSSAQNNSGGFVGGGISGGYLLVGTSTAPVRFQATGLDVGMATATNLTGRSVDYR